MHKKCHINVEQLLICTYEKGSLVVGCCCISIYLYDNAHDVFSFSKKYNNNNYSRLKNVHISGSVIFNSDCLPLLNVYRIFTISKAYL